MDRFDQLAGIGLKHAHLPRILGGQPVALGFFEVHAENAMSAGGPWPDRLMQLCERFALSVHGVGLSIGGVLPPDAGHLRRLDALLRRYQPRWFSEHLAWGSHGGAFFNDLLPLPYTSATLRRVCDHIDQVQATLRRTMLLENPSTYVEFADSAYGEAEFITEVQRRTGCALLLDVNNAYVSAVNHGRDARAFIDALPLHAVQEIHLAGFAEDRDAAGDRLLIDSHGAPVAEAVWALYAQVIRRTGPLPTLIERDHAVPAFEVQQAEALHAAALMRGAAACADAERQAGWAAALLDPRRPAPAGLRSWNGADPAVRFDVYRNNVVASLTAALADTFAVLQAVVGEAFFAALAARFMGRHPPRSPVLAAWGDALPDFIATDPPCMPLPGLADLARLEFARVQAFHAADAVPLGAAALAARLARPDELPASRWHLHPSVTVIVSAHPVVDLWAAHQGPGAGAAPDPSDALAALAAPSAQAAPTLRAALVGRLGDDVVVLAVDAAVAGFVRSLQAGASLASAVTTAAASDAGRGAAGFDLGTTLALLLSHQWLVQPPTDEENAR